MCLPEHEETVVECPSVELDEFQKSDFPQLVVNLDCKKLKEIHLMDSNASNHATPHVCPINSMQFLTGFTQEKTSKTPQKGEKTVKTDVDQKSTKKRPLETSEMLSQTLIAGWSHPSFQNLKTNTQTQKTKKPKNKN